MDPRRVRQRLSHMLDAIVAIERVTAGRTLRQYGDDPDLAAMVERYLERPSEASRLARRQIRSGKRWGRVLDQPLRRH